MTFREYLTQARPRNLIHDDFVKDALRDHRLPDVSTWQELRRHIVCMNGYHEAIEAGYQVWINYKRFVRARMH